MRSIRSLGPLLALGALAALSGCGTAGSSSSETALPMQQHFEASNDLQQAMSRGDLGLARRAALRIAEVTEIPGLTWDAGPYLRRMRLEAETVAGARSFEEAAAASGRLGAACGSCHIRGTGPRLEGATTAPTGEEGLSGHMLTHAWATDRMWEGLVSPSLDRWRIGARILAEQGVAHRLDPGVEHLGELVHELGRKSLMERDLDRQAEYFADIVTTCATCHAELGLN